MTCHATVWEALIDERTKDLEPFYANAADEVSGFGSFGLRGGGNFCSPY